MGFFFRKKQKRVAANSAAARPMVAIDKLRSSIDGADKRQIYLQNKIDRTILPEAKQKMAKGDKRGALFLMKRKKMYQAEIEKLDNVRMTLETQAIQLESAAHNQDTVGAMQTGNWAMQRLRKAFGLDKVDELMDDMRDEADAAEEISRAIASPLDPYNMVDDDELLRELEELDGGTESRKASATSGFSSFMFPVQKTTQKQKESNDLKKLEAELLAA